MKLAIIGDLKNGTNCTAVDCYLLKDHGTFHKKPRTSAYCWRYLSHFGQEVFIGLQIGKQVMDVNHE